MKELFTYLPCHLALEIVNHPMFNWSLGKIHAIKLVKNKSSACIDQAFHWASTNEGEYYWKDLYYKYYENPYISNIKYLIC